MKYSDLRAELVRLRDSGVNLDTIHISVNQNVANGLKFIQSHFDFLDEAKILKENKDRRYNPSISKKFYERLLEYYQKIK